MRLAVSRHNGKAKDPKHQSHHRAGARERQIPQRSHIAASRLECMDCPPNSPITGLDQRAANVLAQAMYRPCLE